jgi:hypothetical protein
MPHHPVLEPSVVTAIEDYFRLLQAHVSAEQMLAEVVTEDFRTGFVGGHMWDGPEGLAEFLSARSVFFDESHELLQILEVGRQADGRVRARTRLRFFLRRREAEAARSEEYTGDVFHTWMFEPEGGRSRWRVAAQLVDDFADLNGPAQQLFSMRPQHLTSTLVHRARRRWITNHCHKVVPRSAARHTHLVCSPAHHRHRAWATPVSPPPSSISTSKSTRSPRPAAA